MLAHPSSVGSEVEIFGGCDVLARQPNPIHVCWHTVDLGFQMVNTVDPLEGLGFEFDGTRAVDKRGHPWSALDETHFEEARLGFVDNAGHPSRAPIITARSAGLGSIVAVHVGPRRH